MKAKNVLLILSDQQRFDTLAGAGFSHMITPHLDALLADSCYYSCAHSGNPVCMPARHDLITGFPARVHGYYANSESTPIASRDTPTLPRLFTEQGYRTVAVGKMHFCPTQEHHGFNEMHLMEELPKLRQADAYATFLKEEGHGEVQNLHGVRHAIYHEPQQALVDVNHHGTNWVADRANQWLDENNDHPFFMMCGFIQPHPPWNNPQELLGMYDDVEVPDAIAVSRLPFEQDCPAWFGDDDTIAQKQEIRRAYYTAISMVDRSVGKLIAHLKAIGKYDETLIIYTSDHGEMLQDKGYYSKELPYDSAARVPMIVKYPHGERAGECCHDFADLLDILPTCLDVCGLSYPENHQALYGQSLAQQPKRDYQYAATGTLPTRWVMCRNQQYKYVYHFNGGHEELYDMQDPNGEVCNLLAQSLTSEQQRVLCDLREKAVAYETQWGIPGNVKDGAFVPVACQEFHATVRGKYHFWANEQTQPYWLHEATGAQRAARLEAELQQANYLQIDWYDHPEWQQSQQQAFKLYSAD